MTSHGGRQQLRYITARRDVSNDVSKSLADATDDAMRHSWRTELLPNRHWVERRNDPRASAQTVGDRSSTLISDGECSDCDSSISDDSPPATAKFRLATYNILSDDAVKPGEYLYCPSQLRYMASRHERIINEIQNMQPHVVCFQVQVQLSLSLSLSLSVCHCLSVFPYSSFCLANRFIMS